MGRERTPIELACEKILSSIIPTAPLATFTVGHDQRSTIYVYEHKRKFKYQGPREVDGFKVVRKYIGKLYTVDVGSGS